MLDAQQYAHRLGIELYEEYSAMKNETETGSDL